MKKFTMIAAAFIIGIAACNSNSPKEESETSEPVVQDSMNASTSAPVTDSVNSSTVESIKQGDPTAVPKGVETKEVKYTNDKGETVSATYHEGGGIGVVNIVLNGEEIKLMQGESKDGGNTYTNGKINWKVNGDIATMEKDNVITTFKTKK